MTPLIRCYEDQHRRSRENLVIHIFSDTPVNEERVKQAIRDHCEQEMSNKRWKSEGDRQTT